MTVQLDNIILERLYLRLFQDGDTVNLNDIQNELDIDRRAFWKKVESMTDQGYIKAKGLGGYFEITALGVLYAEREKIAPPDITQKNERARTKILAELARVYEKNDDNDGEDIDDIAKNIVLDRSEIENNIDLLLDAGYIQSAEVGCFVITRKGSEAVEQWRLRNKMSDEFDQITNHSPQVRGRSLQKLLAKVVEEDGWSQEEGVRTSNEEMDIVLYKNREYYLVECKWEKEPIEAAVVRELYGKVRNRAGAGGILISMSGFTSGAIRQAEDYVNDRLIIFFGSNDVESLVYGNNSIEPMLNHKHQQLITRRRIVFD
jgi:predicted transcriptional regulator